MGTLNDLWRYNVDNNTWAWMSGSTTTDAVGNYGDRGILDPSNMPGGRRGAFVWYDSFLNELWLFGGYGKPNQNSLGA